MNHDKNREGQARERKDAAYEERATISCAYPQKLQGQQRNKDTTAIQEPLQCHTTKKKGANNDDGQRTTTVTTTLTKYAAIGLASWPFFIFFYFLLRKLLLVLRGTTPLMENSVRRCNASALQLCMRKKKEGIVRCA